MAWKATKVSVFGGYPEPGKDGVDILVKPDDKAAKRGHWHVFVWVPPCADPKAAGWVIAEGWLSTRAVADGEAADIVSEHGCELVAPDLLPGTRFTTGHAFQLRAVEIPSPSAN